MEYNEGEKEAIGLSISFEAVRNIVNHSLLKLQKVSKYPGEFEVHFHSTTHQELFIIRLLDFVIEKGDNKLTGVAGSCFTVLKSACNTRSFDINNSIHDLQLSVQELDD